MKSKMAKIVKPVVFLLVGIVIFSVVQEVFIPANSRKNGNTDRVIDGLNHIDPGTVDVLFLGSSLFEFDVSPMRLYERTGICSYSLATGAQPIDATYWVLKDALTKQNPSVVFLLASSLYRSKWFNNASWRYILDNYRLSPFKFEMARDYDRYQKGDGWFAALFPIVKYHTRWNALVEDGLSIPYGGEYYSLGQWINSEVVGSYDATPADINRNENLLQQAAYITERLEGGTAETKAVEQTYVPSQILEDELNSFMRIRELCEENNAKLVLLQVPKLLYPKDKTIGAVTWTRAQSDEVRELARANGVAFCDLVYDTDIGINWASEGRDAGAHLNIRGADKVTDAVGSYLLEHFPVRQQNNPQYDAYAARYDKIREVAMLQSETDLLEYLNRLEQKKDQWSVFIVACDEYTAGMKTEVYDKFEELGLSLIREGQYRDAYLAVIDRGEVKYEAVSGRKINYDTEIDGMPLWMYSAGWNVSADCIIKLGGVEYAKYDGGRGLNFVVYDHETGLVIDSVRFDTGVADNTFDREYVPDTGDVGGYLRAYEAKACF